MYATKDNAEGQLAAGISAAATSIVLGAGEGAEFPQPYTGDCSSTGSATVLNDTGALASLVVGDFIRNVTDGSWAFITVEGTNSITTTTLRGGTLNVWTSADVWQVNEFVVTLEVRDADGDVTQREKVLIKNRSTDTLTARTRGYDSSTAAAFSTSDYVNLHVVSNIVEHMIDCIYDQVVRTSTDQTDITTANTNITNQQTGSYHYVVTTGSANDYVAATPAFGAYAAGNFLRIKANFTNTGAATIAVNGLAATAIKKDDGSTALAANDIISGQIVELVFDGTNFQMITPIGTPAVAQTRVTCVYCSGTSSAEVGASSVAELAIGTHNYTIPANDLINGVVYEFEGVGEVEWGTDGDLTFRLRLGGTSMIAKGFTPTTAADKYMVRGRVYGTAAAGASVAVRATLELHAVDNQAIGAQYVMLSYGAASVATNGTLVLDYSIQFSTSQAAHAVDMDVAEITKRSSTTFSL